MDLIYREELMEHYKNPQNHGKMENPSVEITENNPMCGDVINLQLKISENEIIDTRFNGQMCAVSTASASILTEEIKNKNLEEAKDFSKKELLEMLGTELTTSRVKCAQLPLEALNKSIKKYEQNK